MVAIPELGRPGTETALETLLLLFELGELCCLLSDDRVHFVDILVLRHFERILIDDVRLLLPVNLKSGKLEPLLKLLLAAECL